MYPLWGIPIGRKFAYFNGRMHPQIFSPEFGPIELIEGMPGMLAKYALPAARPYYSSGRYGIICLQILPTERQVLSYFLFQLSQQFSFSFLNPLAGLQTFINLSGRFRHRVDGSDEMPVHDSEYLLYSAQQEVLHTAVEQNRLSSCLHIYFLEDSYLPLLPLFPQFSTQLNDEKTKPFFIFQGPVVVPPAVRDSIRSILNDRFAQPLHQKHVELHPERTLFEQLVKGLKLPVLPTPSKLEKQKATEASQLLLSQLQRPWLVEDIASELYCTEAWLYAPV